MPMKQGRVPPTIRAPISLGACYRTWQSIAMDFITDLPLSKGCDQLWAVID